jgi:hypothetical protein
MVEEVAVVGGGDHRSGVAVEVLFEPLPLSASRWLVGSSSSSRSGRANNNRHSATRRCSPPERLVTFASGGGQRSASIACSMRASMSQAPRRPRGQPDAVGICGVSGEFVDADQHIAQMLDVVAAPTRLCPAGQKGLSDLASI